MKMRSFILSLAFIGLLIPVALSGATKDPVVMNIDGNDVRLSEFEYLYKKNSGQHEKPVSLDEYVDMFINYKLKVRAAIDEKMDTLPNIRKDIEQFRVELAAPYMRDSVVDDSLCHLLYAHKLVDIEARGIALPGNKRALADSIHALLMEGADFATLAKEYSIERSAKKNGGYLGFVFQGKFPAFVEDALYETADGEITPVIGSSEGGWVILKAEKRRPDPGEVKVRHIMKMTVEKNTEEVKQIKQEIDSIYNLIKNGVPFSELTYLTDEPSGKKNGGELPWFGVGRMVPQFERAAFALNPGEISEPVKSPFGYHIILCEDKRPVGSYESMKEKLKKAVMEGDRANIAVESSLDRYMQQKGFVTDSAAVMRVKDMLKANGGLNEASRTALKESPFTLFTEAGMPVVNSRQLVESMEHLGDLEQEAAALAVDRTLRSLKYGKAKESYINNLSRTSSRYNYLFNEYSDGILLCEISNERVWNKANTDTAGLEDCFRRNRELFKWDRPRYRGYLIAAKDDSIAQAAENYLLENKFEPKDYATELRKRFLNDVKIEKVIVAKGDNAVVDYLVFGGSKPDIKARWKGYRTFDGAIIDQPEKATDAKGAVSRKYQQELEDAWIKELRSKYKVKVNKSVLDKLR